MIGLSNGLAPTASTKSVPEPIMTQFSDIYISTAYRMMIFLMDDLLSVLSLLSLRKA